MKFELRELSEVLRARGERSKSGHYDDVAKGLFTPPVKITDRRVGWPVHEIDAIQAAVIAGYTPDQIRALVAKLVADRRRAVAEVA